MPQGYLLEMGHSGNLFVNLVGIFRVEVVGNGHDRTTLVGAASFVPIGTRGSELRGAHNVNTAVVTRQQILEMSRERMNYSFFAERRCIRPAGCQMFSPLPENGLNISKCSFTCLIKLFNLEHIEITGS